MTINNTFWNSLKKLTGSDDSVEVPQQTVTDAVAIFDRQPQSSWSGLFQLRPAMTGMVRRGNHGKKYLYEMGDDYMIQLEKTETETGIVLAGIAHGLEDSPVVLYNDEYVSEATLEDGNFEFKGVPAGTCSLSFEHEGETFWITGLELNQESAN